MKHFDENKEYLLKYLLQLELPEVLQDKQIRNLEDCFIYGKYDKELSEIGDQGVKLWEIDFVYGLLND